MEAQKPPFLLLDIGRKQSLGARTRIRAENPLF
jgi:hypothetical protein